MGFLISSPVPILNYKRAARAASTFNELLSSVLPIIIDNISLAHLDRVLLKNQTAPAENGIYEVIVVGGNYSLARTSDANSSSSFKINMAVAISEGTVNADKVFQINSDATIILGTTAITFSAIEPPAASLVPPQNSQADKVLATDGSASSWRYAGLGSGGFGSGNLILGRAKPTGLTGTNNSIAGDLAGDSATSALRLNCFGYRAGFAQTTSSYSVYIGAYAGDVSALGSYNVAVGDVSMYNQTAGISSATCLGFATSASGDSAVSIGASAQGSGIALGAGSTSGSNASTIVIGRGAVPDYYVPANGLSIGSTAYPIYTIFLYSASHDTQIRTSLISADPNSSAAAKTLTLSGSQGTGTGLGSDVIISTSPAGSSGSNVNAYVERLRVTADGKVNVNAKITAASSGVASSLDNALNGIITLSATSALPALDFNHGASVPYSRIASTTGASGSTLLFSISQSFATGLTLETLRLGPDELAYSHAAGVRFSIGSSTVALGAAGYTSTITGKTIFATPGDAAFLGTEKNGARIDSGSTYSSLAFGSAPHGKISVTAGASGSEMFFGTSSSYASGITTTALSLNWLGDVKAPIGNLIIETAGKGLQIKEDNAGNARMGVATLIGGTLVVSNTSVTANTRIMLTAQNNGGNIGFLSISARTGGTSFTILSSSNTDTSIVAWMLVEPA